MTSLFLFSNPFENDIKCFVGIWELLLCCGCIHIAFKICSFSSPLCVWGYMYMCIVHVHYKIHCIEFGWVFSVITRLSNTVRCFCCCAQVVAITVFFLLTVAYYAFFAPFLGNKLYEYIAIGVYSFLVRTKTRLLH